MSGVPTLSLTGDPLGAVLSPPPAALDVERWCARLKEWFGVELTVIDTHSGEVLHWGADQPAWHPAEELELCRAVAEQGEAGLLAEEGPVLVLALPIATPDGARRVDSAEEPISLAAVGVFAAFASPSPAELAAAAAWLKIDESRLMEWLQRQQPIAPETLLRMAGLAVRHMISQRRLVQLEAEVDSLSKHLCGSYEEISLIYQLTDNLTLARKEEELGRRALEWLSDIVPADGLALQRLYDDDETRRGRYLTCGNCPVSSGELNELVAYMGLDPARRLLVANRSTTSQPSWPAPGVRQMIVVALSEGDHVWGWLAAFNHATGGEFGTVEANLLSSVSAILGIHRGNSELYREQAVLLTNIVYALTSAIDAKDPYTCGHSDRVARVAVRLARELGCGQNTLESIYLSGLLHDVGKIGIDDNVLRKPGRLTTEEFEHIKTHPQLGYNILVGIKQLGDVLPVVLHHHEAWDGSGYPHGLAGQHIPKMARIAAVADAFDAMGSDRPYRKGMSEEKLDFIIREGAGKQWDPEVVQAFFRAREDIREISRRENDENVPELLNFFAQAQRKG